MRDSRHNSETGRFGWRIALGRHKPYRKQSMRWQLLILTWLAVVPLAAGAEDAAVVELREAVRAWIELEDRISVERADWQVEKDRMGRLLGLYREELKLLGEELEKAGSSAGGHQERMKKAREEVARLRLAQITATETLATAVPRVLRLAGQFPEPLRAEAADELATLQAWKVEDEARDGLRALLGVLSRADGFHRRLTRTREVREGREVEVIYLGLARAYYVAEGMAGIGVPKAGGWEWTEKAELAGELNRALAMLEQRRPPAVVKLPVAVVKVAGSGKQGAGDPEKGGAR